MSQTEKTILAGLLNDSEFCKKTIPFLQEEYFLDRVDRAVFRSIKDFVNQYKGIPTKDALLIALEDNKGLTEDEFSKCKSLVGDMGKSPKQDTQWLSDTTEKFCKDKAIYNAILESIQIIDGKDKARTPHALPEILSKALAVSFDTNVGHDFLEDYESRHEFYHRVERKVPFDLEMFNAITKGGISPKTLNIIMAGTGVGKSLFMCHHAAACLMQNRNVLYITLEMAEERIAERIDANIMDITMDELQDLPLEMYEKRLKGATRGVSGKLIVKEYPTSFANVNHFRILLDELCLKKQFTPDIIFVDYINICSSARFKHGNNINSYGYIKAIAEELRGLAMERDVPIVSATQVNRAGFSSTDVDLTDTSESFGLPHTADLMIALITTDELEKAGQIMVKQLKNRYNGKAANKKFIVGLNYAKMKFYDIDSSVSEDLMDANIQKGEGDGYGSGYGAKDFTAKFGKKRDTSDWNI
jgi:replicative DNA helicase